MKRIATPQDVSAFLTPEQVQAIQERYNTRESGQALLNLLLAAAGVWVLAEMIRDDEAEEPPKRTRRR